MYVASVVPVVTTAILLAEIACAKRIVTVVVDSQDVASAFVRPKRALALAANDPNPVPSKVKLLEPVLGWLVAVGGRKPCLQSYENASLHVLN